MLWLWINQQIHMTFIILQCKLFCFLLFYQVTPFHDTNEKFKILKYHCQMTHDFPMQFQIWFKNAPLGMRRVHTKSLRKKFMTFEKMRHECERPADSIIMRSWIMLVVLTRIYCFAKKREGNTLMLDETQYLIPGLPVPSCFARPLFRSQI